MLVGPHFLTNFTFKPSTPYHLYKPHVILVPVNNYTYIIYTSLSIYLSNYLSIYLSMHALYPNTQIVSVYICTDTYMYTWNPKLSSLNPHPQNPIPTTTPSPGSRGSTPLAFTRVHGNSASGCWSLLELECSNFHFLFQYPYI